MGGQLRQLIRRGEPFVTVGISDIHAARMAEAAGFKCLFLSSQAVTQIYNIPNHVGLITMTELLLVHERIAPNVGIPIVADVEDLGGNPLSVHRHTKLFEKAGLGGLYVDDLPGTSMVRYSKEPFSKKDMVANIRAAADAKADVVLCVNCLARQTIDSKEKFDEAVERGIAYAEAGADVLSIGTRNIADMKRFSDAVKRPLLTGIQIPLSRMKEAGLAINVYETFAIQLGALQRALTELKDTGTLAESMKMELSQAERDNLLGRADEYKRLAQKYGVI